MDGGVRHWRRGGTIFIGALRFHLKKMTHGLVKGRVWGELRNPAHGGTFDLFYGNQVYE